MRSASSGAAQDFIPVLFALIHPLIQYSPMHKFRVRAYADSVFMIFMLVPVSLTQLYVFQPQLI